MASVIVIGLRFRHYMRGKHMEEELTLARRVQYDLFPSEDSLVSSLQFAAKCVPAYQVGGDLYDVFEMDDGEVGMVLGDVSGKGLPAALLMGVVQGAVRASSVTGAAARHEHAAERLNQLLCMKTARERFVSLFWCYFDRRVSMLRYVNAGHLPPLLIRQDRGGKQKVIRLDSGGVVLGLLPGARYTQAEVQVEPGDLLIVFSDGILEAANSKDEEFGEKGVLDSVARNWERQPREVCGAILADVRTFLGKELPQDDQTLLVIRLDAAAREIEATSAHRVGAAGPGS
jgi:sigma-B regulation protein RsbU (phosphoserine phosphatase)